MPNVIYGLHEAGSDEIRYVGKTCDLSKRLGDHGRGESRYWNRLFFEWTVSVKASGHLCAKILEESPEDWRVAEITWIRRLKRGGHRLLNSAPGGNGASQGFVVSDETRARLSAANKTRIFSQETRARMSFLSKNRIYSPAWRKKLSDAGKRRVHSPETRARLSMAMKGRVLSPSWRKKISDALKGKKPSLESRAKMSAAQKIRCLREARER